ncbi:MAG: LysM peptidoglycan-binding domain-containing protein [Gammaproteobacteria bacterium]|nr:LysM peptidoglycan-binding domain-containing protein [Gammaproteobacteria bacterium]
MNLSFPNFDPVQALLSQTALKNSLFSANSRYYGLEPLTITRHGTIVAYIPRRFVPSPSRFQLLQEHTVVQGERLDNIAGQYLGDPTLFWRLCDANNALRPEALTETPGRRLRITLPEGIVGNAL